MDAARTPRRWPISGLLLSAALTLCPGVAFSAVLVSTGDEQRVLTEPYTGADVAAGKVNMLKTSPGMMRDDYGSLLAMQPVRPRLFIVHFDAGTSVLTPASQSMLPSIRAELTVLFTDVRGFTALAETLPPAELAQLMNNYLSAVTDVIRAHRGTLDKYIGDAVLAFWGAPIDDPQHARHAVEAALAMQAVMSQVNQRFLVRAWPSLQIATGINTGSMIAGDMGSRHRRTYTVLGDAVNLASRLQGLSTRYGAGVIIGEATRAALGDWPCRQLDRVTVRGRSVCVAIYEPLTGGECAEGASDCSLG